MIRTCRRYLVAMATVAVLVACSSPAIAKQTITATLTVPPGTSYSARAPEKYVAELTDDRYPLRAVVAMHIVRSPYATVRKLRELVPGGILGKDLQGQSGAATLDSAGLIERPVGLNQELFNTVRQAISRAYQDQRRGAVYGAVGANQQADPDRAFAFGQLLMNARAARGAAYAGTGLIKPSSKWAPGLSGVWILEDPAQIDSKDAARAPAASLTDAFAVQLKDRGRWYFDLYEVDPQLPGGDKLTMVEVRVEWGFELAVDPDSPESLPLMSLTTETSGAEEGKDAQPSGLTDQNHVSTALNVTGLFPLASQLPPGLKPGVGVGYFGRVQSIASIEIVPDANWPVLGWMRDRHMGVLVGHTANGKGRSVAAATLNLNEYASMFAGIALQDSLSSVHLYPAVGFSLNLKLGSEKKPPSVRLKVVNGALAEPTLLRKETGIVEFRFTGAPPDVTYTGHFEYEGDQSLKQSDRVVRIGPRYDNWLAWCPPGRATALVIDTVQPKDGTERKLAAAVRCDLGDVTVTAGKLVSVDLTVAGTPTEPTLNKKP